MFVGFLERLIFKYTIYPWPQHVPLKLRGIRHYAIPKRHKLPPRPKWLIVEDEIEESFIKGGRGPGGQKINKSNSKVQLKHIPTGVVVTCQHSRSQESNRKKAREILALKLEEIQNPDNCRTSVLNERKMKLKRSKMKKANRKYKNFKEGDKDDEEQIEIIDIEDDFNNFISTKAN